MYARRCDELTLAYIRTAAVSARALPERGPITTKGKGKTHRERSAWMCHADPVNHEQHECSVLHHGYGSRRVPAEEFFHIVPVVAVERGELARPAR